MPTLQQCDNAKHADLILLLIAVLEREQILFIYVLIYHDDVSFQQNNVLQVMCCGIQNGTDTLKLVLDPHSMHISVLVYTHKQHGSSSV